MVIGAGQTKDVLFVLSLKPEAWENDRVLDTYVTIFTNVTVVKIPLVCFHGLVKTFLPDAPLTQLDPLDDKEEDGLDFGTLGTCVVEMEIHVFHFMLKRVTFLFERNGREKRSVLHGVE